VLGHVVRDASLDELAEAGEPVRADDDRAGVDLVGDLDDASPRWRVHRGSSFGVEAGLARKLGSGICLRERSLEDGEADVGGT